MKCPGCGYESFDLLETCKHCGAPLVASVARAPADDPATTCWACASSRSAPASLRRRCSTTTRSRSERTDLDAATLISPAPAPSEDDGGPPFGSTTTFSRTRPRPRGPDAVPAPPTGPIRAASGRRPARICPGRPSLFPGADRGAEACGEPIIDRDDEVPERYWAPEVAGLGRRALALLVDQSLLLALLGVFFLGALAGAATQRPRHGFAPGRRRFAGVGPALRAARRAAQPRLLQLLSRVHGPHAGQGAGRHRGPNRRRRRPDLGPGDPALARCGPRPGVRRRRHLLGDFRAAPARLGRSDFRNGGRPAAAGTRRRGFPPLTVATREGSTRRHGWNPSGDGAGWTELRRPVHIDNPRGPRVPCVRCSGPR